MLVIRKPRAGFRKYQSEPSDLRSLRPAGHHLLVRRARGSREAREDPCPWKDDGRGSTAPWRAVVVAVGPGLDPSSSAPVHPESSGRIVPESKVLIRRRAGHHLGFECVACVVSDLVAIHADDLIAVVEDAP